MVAREEKPGHLRERRPGVWEVIVSAPRDPITGRRRQLSRIAKGDRRAADAKRDEMLAEVRAGHHGDAELALAALLEHWLRSERDELSVTTYNEYARISRNLIAKAPLGATPVRRITPAVLTDYYRALRRSGRAAGTVRKVHAVIRGALSHAVLAEWIDANPADKAKRSRGDSGKGAGRLRAPTSEDVAALVNAAQTVNPELAAFLRLAVATGARRGELCGLRRSDIDVDARVVHIQRAVVHNGPALVVKDTKTHADRRRTVGANAMALLGVHLAAMDVRAKAAGRRIGTHAYVFSSRADCSTPWKPDTVTTYFVTLRNRLASTRPSVKAVRLHDLRHFKGTLELDAGIPAPTVAEGLGHSNPATTLRVYAHGTAASSELAAEVGDDLFG